ncbi:replication associated protein [Myodefec virus RodL3_976]|uniref:Replication-associated protein n=1 Tax=Myodefec virus RodL3_976 TaxID=2929259 RepID=A0A976N200_9VIRU|nr:replication associated protein [Myodefec virus RodL3_976]
MTQATWWVGTKFVDEFHNSEEWLKSLVDQNLVRFVIGQRELCPTTMRHHVQFCVNLHRSQRLSYLKKVDRDAHWEPMRGTADQAREYCSKSETRFEGPWEFGKAGAVGQRKGYDDAVAAICSGMCVADVAAEFPTVWVKYGRGLVDLRKQLQLDSDRRVFGEHGPELWVFWGPSGSGKSRKANETWPDAYWKIPGEKWWDGYTNQDTVILDDFKGSFMRLTDFQRLIDRYPLWVEVKGGSIPMLATRYVITSNEAPEAWYSSADPHGTVTRRCNDFSDNGRRIIYIGPEGQERPDFSSWVSRVGCGEFAG